jgi:hypothetical protein
MKKEINKEMIRDIWNKFPGEMNIKQKIILAIFIPIVLFFITYTIAYYISVDEVVIRSAYTEKMSSTEMVKELIEAVEEGRQTKSPYIYHPAVTRKYYYPFDWQRTWYVWILFLTLCGVFEYKLFEDKK